ncbi:uncharacterized protein BN778_00639 [Mycoplasma sp. CAG:776]|nr:uncharacterized protein BN778_00639 [Mycoplasma sp. CAG:776]
MKNLCIKMAFVVLITSSLIIGFKEKNKEKVIVENIVINNVLYRSDTPLNRYEEETVEEKLEEAIVYEGLTLEELGLKIDNVLNSTLDGYGKIIASLAIEKGVDPVVAASIILVETGCKWTCSSLVRNANNVGGMKASSGKYAKFETLDAGLEAFINNLANNYYAKGLTTPEAINTKYAANPNWHDNVYYYVEAIMNS